MNQDGKIVERRSNIISFDRVLTYKMLQDEEFVTGVLEDSKPVTFKDALKKSREENVIKFFDLVNKEAFADLPDEEDKEILAEVISAKSELKDSHHRAIKRLLKFVS